MDVLGRHILVEYYECDPDILKSSELIESHLNKAAILAGATVVESVFHLFNPHGVSGVVVIAESHLTIHTWPEYGYAAVDLFTCGDTVAPDKAIDYLKTALNSGNSSTVEVERGQAVNTERV